MDTFEKYRAVILDNKNLSFLLLDDFKELKTIDKSDLSNDKNEKNVISNSEKVILFFKSFEMKDDGTLLETDSGGTTINKKNIFAIKEKTSNNKHYSFFLNPLYSFKELGISHIDDIEKVIEQFNNNELGRALSELSIVNNLINDTPNSMSVKQRIKYLEEIVGKFKLWFHDKNLSINNKNSELEIELEHLKNEHRVTTQKVKELKNVIKQLKLKSEKINKPKLKAAIDRNRFTNGKVNFSKVASEFGYLDGSTIKKWILKLGLSEFAKIK